MPQVYRAIRPMFVRDKWRICRDDIVYILRGPEKGQTGKVLEVIKDTRLPQVIVEGRNLRKKKVPDPEKGKDPSKDFFVITMEAPMHYSNVQLYDSATQQPVRVVFKYDEAGSLVRVKKSAGAAPSAGDVLPWPTEDDEEVSDLAGARDTSEKAAKAITYDPVSDRFPFRIRELERMWARSHGKHAAYTYADVDEQGVIDTLQPRTATPLLTGSGQSPSGVAQARQYSSAANSSSSSSRGQRRAVWGFAAAPFL